MLLKAVIRELYKSECAANVTPLAEGEPAHEMDAISDDALGVVLYRDHQPVYVYRYWGWQRELRANKCANEWEAGASWTNQEIYN